MFKGEGEEEHPALRGLYLSLGAILAFGLVLLERQYSWTLLQFGVLGLIVAAVCILYIMYFFFNVLRGEEKKSNMALAILFFLLRKTSLLV